jgi:Carboxypeptidase regulatory-like domain/TonB dependent receptor
MKIKNIMAVFCTFLLMLFAGAALHAQDISGTISGTVVDGTGAAVAGATVTITNTEKNDTHTATTNDHGEFTVPNLLVGHYTVTVEAKNFKKIEQKEIMLNVHDQLGLSFKLEVGSATETLTVNAGELRLETQSATQAGLVAPKEIHELPLNTRNFIQLVTLMPGVSSSSQLDTFYIGNSLPSGTTATIPFSFNGERNSAGYWTLDGADNVDRGSNLTLLDFPSIDAIEEFKVLRGQYDPEFGRSEGAQITVVTKSGGSKFHGDAYEFFRNDVLQANNPLNKLTAIPTARPPLRYNDFGYTIGGPIWIPHVFDGKQHKTYFFFSQEVRRVITYGTVTAAVPTPAMLTGNFTGLICTSFDSTGHCLTTGNHIATIDPVAAAYIKDIWNLMPAPVPSPTTNNAVVNLRNIFNANQQLIRVDHTFSDKFTLFGRFIHDGIPTVEPGGLFTGAALPGVSTTATSDPGYNFIVHGVTTISPTLLNDGGFQYSQGAILSVPIGRDNSVQSPDIHPILPFTNTLGRIPALAMTGMSSITGFGPYNDYNRNYNVFDNQTWIKGKHTMKFGVSFNHYQKTENTAGNNVGSFTINTSGQVLAPLVGADTNSFEQSWANFLLGRVATFTQASIDITPNIQTNQTEFYAQDTWRLKQNLTVTYGFRYSFFRQPTDVNKESTNFDPTLFNPANAPTIDSNGLICTVGPCAGGGTPNPTYNVLNGIIVNNGTSPYGAKISNEDNSNIAPRLGFAWQPFSNGKTVVRGGFGMFYDSTLFGIIEQNIFANPPFVNSATINNVTLDNPAAGTAVISATPKALHATMLPNHTPYVEQWSLDIQHEFPGGFFLDAAYIGNAGRHLLGEEDINMPKPGAYVAAGLSTTVSQGITIGSGGVQNETLVNIIRPYKGYGPITAIENNFSSNYNGLQVEGKKQMRDLLFKVDYTWSRALTNNQTDRSTAPQNLYDIASEYGPLQQDRTQIFSADVVYSLPWFRSQQGFKGHFLGGWQVSAIVSAATGLPLTVTTTESIDPAGDGACSCSASPAGLRPDMVANPNAGAAHQFLNWFNGTAFTNVPATATRPGNETRGQVRGPGYQIWNMALDKNIRVTETTGFEFRAEAFNMFNHTNPFGIGTQLNSATYNHITSFRDPRVLQLGLKFNF